jgi:hypothetical protein
MYTYLRNIGPFYLWSFPFLKSLGLFCKLQWLFRSCLLESHLVILTFGKSITSGYFFIYKALSQRSLALPYIFHFLRKEIMELVLLSVFWIAPQPDHAPECLIQVFFGDKVVRNKIWLLIRSCFHGEFTEIFFMLV